MRAANVMRNDDDGDAEELLADAHEQSGSCFTALSGPPVSH